MKRVTVASTITSLLIICFFIIILSGKNCHDCFSAPVMMIKFIACGLVIFIGSLHFTRIYLKNEKSIFNIETQPLLETNEAAIGLPFSCEGIVTQVKNKLLKAPYSGQTCVYYHSITEKRVRSGKSYRWVIEENLVDFLPFYVSDDRGTILVDPTNLDSDFSGYRIDARNRSIPDPENSEIDCTRVFKNQPIESGTSFLGMSVTGNLRRSEFILPPGIGVFVYGLVCKGDSGPVLRESFQFPLIISQKTKDAFVEEFYKGNSLVFLVHFLMATGFSIAVLSANYFFHLNPGMLSIMLLAGNGILTISVFFTMYNRMVTLRQRAVFALNDIDIELKRRADLIPQLNDLVKAYSGYEKEIQTLIAQLRVHTEFLQQLPDNIKVDTSPMAAVMENYPELKAADNFRSLMLSLVDTEERIAYARAFYNRNVRKLNTLAGQFPFIIVAAVSGIKQMSYVTIVSDRTG